MKLDMNTLNALGKMGARLSINLDKVAGKLDKRSDRYKSSAPGRADEVAYFRMLALSEALTNLAKGEADVGKPLMALANTIVSAVTAVKVNATVKAEGTPAAPVEKFDPFKSA